MRLSEQRKVLQEESKAKELFIEGQIKEGGEKRRKRDTKES